MAAIDARSNDRISNRNAPRCRKLLGAGAHGGKNLATFCSSRAMSSGCINEYLSGMSRHMTRFPFSREPNLLVNFDLWVRSMTKMICAHAICSSDTIVIASGARPAESASTLRQRENTSSAVGLRSRFRLQMNSARVNYHRLIGNRVT